MVKSRERIHQTQTEEKEWSGLGLHVEREGGWGEVWISSPIPRLALSVRIGWLWDYKRGVFGARVILNFLSLRLWGQSSENVQ